MKIFSTDNVVAWALVLAIMCTCYAIGKRVGEAYSTPSQRVISAGFSTPALCEK